MPPSFNPNGTPSVGTVSTALSTASQSTGVPLPILTAIAYNESSYGQNPNIPPVGPAGEVGIMQLTPPALETVNQQFGTTYTSADMADPNASALAAAQYVSILAKTYGGNTDAAIAAYNAGPGNVNKVISQFGTVTPQTLAASGLPHSATYLQNAQNTLGNANNLAPGQAVPQSDNAAIHHNPFGDPLADPIKAMPLPVLNVSKEQLAAIAPPLITDQDGLDVQPWYQDTNILTGNPRLHKLGFPQGFPIVFEVFMEQNNPNSLLSRKNSSVGSNSLIGSLIPSSPITIPLNCSLTNFKVSSRHVVNKVPTRTGFHLTMWGMGADIIEGSGSTGVFMNQFGLTDFLSVAGTNAEAVAAVLAGFSHTSVVPAADPVLSPEQQAVQAQDIAQSGVATNLADVEPFRVAAEDAFIEFLSLFKMNGTTWLHASGYDFDTSNQASGTQNNPNQTDALAVYSPDVGATDIEIKAKNNDVYKRGYVVMKFRNSQYLGFFKSLSWMMDAEAPFQWKFNFVFQVERTLSLIYYPSPSLAPASTNTFVVTSGVQN